MSFSVLDDHASVQQRQRYALEHLRHVLTQEQLDLLWYSRPRPYPMVVQQGVLMASSLFTLIIAGLAIYNKNFWLGIIALLLCYQTWRVFRWYKRYAYLNRGLENLYYGLTKEALWMATPSTVTAVPLETLSNAHIYRSIQFRFRCADPDLHELPLMRFHFLHYATPHAHGWTLPPEQAQNLKQALWQLGLPISEIPSTPPTTP